MSSTIAAIAAEAFGAVAAELPDVIKSFSLTRRAQGEYDTVAGEHSIATSTDVGRAVFDFSTAQNFMESLFPGYTIGPADKLVYFEGLTTLSPAKGDAALIGGVAHTVQAAVNIMEAGSLYAAIVR